MDSTPQIAILAILLLFAYLFIRKGLGQGAGAPAGIAQGPGGASGVPDLNYSGPPDTMLIDILTQLVPLMLDDLTKAEDDKLEDREHGDDPTDDKARDADELAREEKEKKLRDQMDRKGTGDENPPREPDESPLTDKAREENEKKLRDQMDRKGTGDENPPREPDESPLTDKAREENEKKLRDQMDRKGTGD